jgi:hypothetical protein
LRLAFIYALLFVAANERSTAMDTKTMTGYTGVVWRPADTWVEEEGCYPNELVLVLVEVSHDSHDCLVDQVEGTKYVSMGHWYPDIELSDGRIEKGHWEVVGWNWCQDTFRANGTDTVVGWAPLPTV